MDRESSNYRRVPQPSSLPPKHRTETPPYQLDTFRKILVLERDHGYKNEAVYGGLDNFLTYWASGRSMPIAATETLRLLKNDQLLDIPYKKLSVESRARWVDRVFRCLADASRTTSGTPSQHADSPPTSSVPSTAHQEHRPEISLKSSISVLRSINRSSSAALARLGVETLGDLIYHFPRRHNDFSRPYKIAELVPGQEQTVTGVVWEIRDRKLGRAVKVAEAIVGDETGNVRVIWFNQPYLARSIPNGSRLVLSGQVRLHRGRLVLESPEYEILKGQDDLVHAGRLVPVYPLTDGLSARTVRRATREALDNWSHLIREYLPENIRRKENLLPLQTALDQAHYPRDQTTRQAAFHRLAFDELFLMQLLVLSRRRKWRDREDAAPLCPPAKTVQAFLSALPFKLTEAQRQVLNQILRDIGEVRPMSRLLQGEVGSGKTVVALAALLVAATMNYQAALMAPTEILAEQHFLTVQQLLQGLVQPNRDQNSFSFCLDGLNKPITVGLLTGSHSRKIKERTHERLLDGDLNIIIGTQALIQEGIAIPNLALAVVDEQHRFGVMQRAALRGKGRSPHILVMSATPIPRSLALTLYGDLDVSIIDTLPPGRVGVVTRWISSGRRSQAEEFVSRQVRNGRQAFIICPIIEESDALQLRAATEEYHRLSRDVFPDLSLGLLHGKLPSHQKNQVMSRFRSGELDILVATPVVEVGVDIPNATVMLVEGANHFGLSQLHQLRGRVGRGGEAGYCLLLADTAGEEAQKRLKAMENLKDGFSVAREDLRLRGPGDFLGTRQSGLPSLRIASLDNHVLLRTARQEATELLTLNPALDGSPDLAHALAEYQRRLETEIS